MIGKDEEVLSVVEQHPATQAVFEHYDAQAGECICCNALFQTIEISPSCYVDRRVQNTVRGKVLPSQGFVLYFDQFV